MKPGIELDVMVFEKVWELEGDYVLTFEENWEEDGEGHYSTDIKAAWEVVEKLADGKKDGRMMDIHLIKQMSGKWCFFFYDEGREYSFFGDTAPHAICLAALKAVE